MKLMSRSIWLAFGLLTLLLIAVGNLQCGEDDATGSSNLLGQNEGDDDACSPLDPLPFELVLWHEGFTANKTMSAADLKLYLDTLSDFVEAKNFKAVFITAPSSIATDDASVVNELTAFVDNLASNGIGIGIQFGLGNAWDSNPDWFDYTEVTSIVGTHDYILGLDSENYHYQDKKIKAANTMGFINDIMQKITDAGGPQPTEIAVAGGAGYNPSDGWAAPLVNVFEYYSSPAALNGVLAGNIDQPSTAFNQCISQKLLKDPTAAGGGIAGGTALGWPAFSFEQNAHDCLASSIGTGGICGSFDVFGIWEWDCVMQFMALFKEQYYSASETPTFVIYQSDFLPCKWLPGGCPKP